MKLHDPYLGLLVVSLLNMKNISVLLIQFSINEEYVIRHGEEHIDKGLVPD